MKKLTLRTFLKASLVFIILIFIYVFVILPFITYYEYEENGTTSLAEIVSITKYYPSASGSWTYKVRLIDFNGTESVNYNRPAIDFRNYTVNDTIKVMFLESDPELFLFKDKYDKYHGLYFGLPFLIIMFLSGYFIVWFGMRVS